MTLLIRTYLNNLKIKLLSKNTFILLNLTKKKGEIKNYLIRSKSNRKKMTISKINKGRLSSTNYEIIEEIETCKNFHFIFYKMYSKYLAELIK